MGSGRGNDDDDEGTEVKNMDLDKIVEDIEANKFHNYNKIKKIILRYTLKKVITINANLPNRV